MSTTHCETGIVRIRVGLFNDILRFVRALCIILHGERYNFIFNCRRITQIPPPLLPQIPPPPPGDAIHPTKHINTWDSHEHTNAHHTSHKKTHYTYTLHETALTHTRTHLSYREARVWYKWNIPKCSNLRTSTIKTAVLVHQYYYFISKLVL